MNELKAAGDDCLRCVHSLTVDRQDGVLCIYCDLNSCYFERDPFGIVVAFSGSHPDERKAFVEGLALDLRQMGDSL